MFGIGILEFTVILIIALIIFGPKRLPELGKSLGRAISEFKKTSKEVKEQIRIEEISADLKKTASLFPVKHKGSADNKGVTALELVIVIAVITIVSAAILATSMSIDRYQVERTEREMESILDASEAYRWSTGSAPSSISSLTTGGQLQQGFGGTNPFGNQYTVSGNSSGTITVQTQVPTNIQSPGIALGSGGTTLSASIPKKSDDAMRLKKRRELFE